MTSYHWTDFPVAGGTLLREGQITSSLWKNECAPWEGVSGWRKQGGSDKVCYRVWSTIGVGRLEREKEEAGTTFNFGRAQRETVELVQSGMALSCSKISHRRKETFTMQAGSTKYKSTIKSSRWRATWLYFSMIDFKDKGRAHPVPGSGITASTHTDREKECTEVCS